MHNIVYYLNVGSTNLLGVWRHA